MVNKQQIMALIQSQQFPQAQKKCDAFCKANPTDAEAWFLLSAICGQLNDFVHAEQYCLKAIELQGNNPMAWYNLGVAQLHQKKYQEAIQSFQQTLQLNPQIAMAHHDMGNALQQMGQYEEALEQYRKTIIMQPELAQAWFNQAVTQQYLERHSEACTSLQQLLSKMPQATEGHFRLGNSLFSLGQYDAAAQSYRQAITLKPAYHEALNNLGNTLRHLGQYETALDCYRQAITGNSDYAEAYSNLGNALQDLGQKEEALNNLEVAVRLKPELADGHFNLAVTLSDSGRLAAAEQSYEKTLELDPKHAEAANNLGNLCVSQGRLQEAEFWYLQAIEIQPDYHIAHSNRLFCLNYHSDYDAKKSLAAHQQWDQQHCAKITAFKHNKHHADPDKILRIAYISPDLCAHSVAFFLEPLLQHHNPSQVESFCYANVKHEDKTSAKLRAHTKHWHNIYGQDDATIAQRIKQDKIDILIDLAGHTAGNNLLTFAWQAAPVQATWLGYPNTTGMQRMAYRITDAYVDPEDDNNPHSEELIRLPKAFSCYQPHPDCPPVGDLPASQKPLTFGSFNNLAKVTDDVISTWAALLQAIPDSSLILKNKALSDEQVRKTFLQRFSEHGISSDRIELIAWTASMVDHMKLYNRIDIALDTFPYNGATTTCESLYMGVPVICQYGKQHASRVSADFMQQVGLAAWIAKDTEDYIAKALELAQDTNTLATIRQKLRQDMLQSSLCDGQRFTHDIEQAFRDMWQCWIKEPG